jgi:hypothetical protein
MYRDMGPTRSLEKLRRSMGEDRLSSTMLQIYSVKHEWVKRVQAYDDHRAAQELKENEQLIKKFKKQRALEALAIADKAYATMNDDKPGSKESRKRWELGVDKFMQILGLDKTKVELSGEVKTNSPDRITHIREALLSTLTPEKRMELSAKLIEIANNDDSKENTE